MSELLSPALRAQLSRGHTTGRLVVADWCVEWAPGQVVVQTDDWRATLRPVDDPELSIAVQLARAQRERTGWWTRLIGGPWEHLLAVELRIDGRHRLELVAPLKARAVEGLGRLDTTGFQIETRELLGLLAALVSCNATLLVDDGRWPSQAPSPSVAPTEPLRPRAHRAFDTQAITADEAEAIAASAARRGRRLVSSSVERVVDDTLDPPVFVALDAETDRQVCISHDPDGEVLLLDDYDDHASFLRHAGLTVDEGSQETIVHCVQRYLRPWGVFLRSVDEIPAPYGQDPRIAGFVDQIAEPWFDVAEETRQIHLWMWSPDDESLVEVLVRQFEDWPITVECHRHLAF